MQVQGPHGLFKEWGASPTGMGVTRSTPNKLREFNNMKAVTLQLKVPGAEAQALPVGYIAELSEKVLSLKGKTATFKADTAQLEKNIAGNIDGAIEAKGIRSKETAN